MKLKFILLIKNTMIFNNCEICGKQFNKKEYYNKHITPFSLKNGTLNSIICNISNKKLIFLYFYMLC